jgi:hypothetical protein
MKKEPDPDLGHVMTLTTSTPQRASRGALIALSAGNGHDAAAPRCGGLTDRPDGYQAPTTQEQDRDSGDQDGPRVLLVDDAAAIRNALRGVLEDAGIEVVGEARTGSRGWR